MRMFNSKSCKMHLETQFIKFARAVQPGGSTTRRTYFILESFAELH